MATIQAFLHSGVNRFTLWWRLIPLPAFLYQRGFWRQILLSLLEYLECGALDKLIVQLQLGMPVTDFYQQISRMYPYSVKDGNFTENWNLQCHWSEFAQQAFDQVADLTKRKHTVYIVGEIDIFHFTHVQKKYGNILPGHHYFSAQKKSSGITLFNHLRSEIAKLHPKLSTEDFLVFSPQAKTINSTDAWFDRFYQTRLNSNLHCYNQQLLAAKMTSQNVGQSFNLIEGDKISEFLSQASRLD